MTESNCIFPSEVPFFLNVTECYDANTFCWAQCIDGYKPRDDTFGEYPFSCINNIWVSQLPDVPINLACELKGCNATQWLLENHKNGLDVGDCSDWLSRQSFCQPECLTSPPHIGETPQKLHCTSQDLLIGGGENCQSLCGPLGSVMAVPEIRKITLGTCPSIWLDHDATCELGCYDGYSYASGSATYSCFDGEGTGGTLDCKQMCTSKDIFTNNTVIIYSSCPDVLEHDHTCPVRCPEDMLESGDNNLYCIDGQLQLNFECVTNDVDLNSVATLQTCIIFVLLFLYFLS